MLTSTFGVIVIVIVGLAALAILEGIVLYAAASPTWKTGPGSSREDRRMVEKLVAPDREAIIAEAEAARVPVGAGHH